MPFKVNLLVFFPLMSPAKMLGVEGGHLVSLASSASFIRAAKSLPFPSTTARIIEIKITPDLKTVVESREGEQSPRGQGCPQGRFLEPE